MSLEDFEDEDGEAEGHIMTDLEAISRFVLAGRAHMTLQSLKTDKHFTYRIKQAIDKKTNEPADVFFVSLLRTGTADGGNFDYVGLIDEQRGFRLTKNSKFPENAKPVLAWRYFWSHLRQEKHAPNLLVFHEGRCGRCGRTLTHPESITIGIGPECASIMGLDLPDEI